MDPLAGMCQSPQSTRIKTSKRLSNHHISETILFIEHSRMGENLPQNEIFFLIEFSYKKYSVYCIYFLNLFINGNFLKVTVFALFKQAKCYCDFIYR